MDIILSTAATVWTDNMEQKGEYSPRPKNNVFDSCLESEQWWSKVMVNKAR